MLLLLILFKLSSMEKELTQDYLKRLAKLARIKIEENKESKLLEDLQKIIDYFKELKTLEPGQLQPMNGGVELVNAIRLDVIDDELSGQGRHSFPEKENNYLKVPEVFENQDVDS